MPLDFDREPVSFRKLLFRQTYMFIFCTHVMYSHVYVGTVALDDHMNEIKSHSQTCMLSLERCMRFNLYRLSFVIHV